MVWKSKLPQKKCLFSMGLHTFDGYLCKTDAFLTPSSRSTWGPTAVQKVWLLGEMERSGPNMSHMCAKLWPACCPWRGQNQRYTHNIGFVSPKSALRPKMGTKRDLHRRCVPERGPTSRHTCTSDGLDLTPPLSSFLTS